MAFQTAAGYGNLPNGNFSAVIYSKKLQMAFRKRTVVGEITNSDYFGEIAEYGDTVRIMKEPEITISDYARGQNVDPQDIDDEDFTLVIDKAKKFAFSMDDIERKHSHINFMDAAADRASYRLRDTYDQEVLAYLSGYRQVTAGTVGSTVNTVVNGTKAVESAGSDELLASMKLSRPSFAGQLATDGATGDSIPVGPRLPGATALPDAFVSPVQLLNRMAKLLDQQYVPMDGRWVVIDPNFKEILGDEDSRFLNADWGESGMLRAGGVPARISGFRVYVSNNLPSVGTGSGTSGTAAQSSNYGVIVAGHDSAVATAEQINKVENFRSQTTFADVVRGLHLYGRKIIRPEGLTTARWNVAT